MARSIKERMQDTSKLINKIFRKEQEGKKGSGDAGRIKSESQRQ